MNEKFKLPKKIRRVGIVETNSSSSHSLAISLDPGSLVKRTDPDFNLPITENNVLYIDSECSKNFGWEFEKFNDCLNKLLYAAGLSYRYCNNGKLDYRKVQKFKNTIKKYLKVNDVVFGWDKKYIEKYVETSPNKEEDDYDGAAFETCIDHPTIDHQSFSDGVDQIFENEQTTIYFIFSRNSWLYCGNDGDSGPKEYKIECEETKDEVKFGIRIYINGDLSENPDINCIDFKAQVSNGWYGKGLKDALTLFSGVIPIHIESDALDSLKWDYSLQKLTISTGIKECSVRSKGNAFISIDKENLYHTEFLIQDEDSGDIYFLMLPTFLDLKEVKYHAKTSNLYRAFIDSEIYTEGFDYKMYKTEIILNEFGV